MPTHTQYRCQDGQVQHGAVRLEPVVLFAMCQLGRSGPTLRTTTTCCDDQLSRHDDNDLVIWRRLIHSSTTYYGIGTTRYGKLPNEPVDTAACMARRNSTMPPTPYIVSRTSIDTMYERKSARRALRLLEGGREMVLRDWDIWNGK